LTWPKAGLGEYGVKNRLILLGLLPLLLAACSADQPATTAQQQAEKAATAKSTSAAQRWYQTQQVSAGAKLFQANCAVCHGKQAQGAANWREPGPDEKYPAPPLNGTGHGWHHPLAILFQVIKYGSPGGQGNMPAWGERLTDDEIIATMAWFQSQWSPEIYQNWAQRDAASRKR
jgi:mono/diheme cytochrome c family protein